VALTPYADLSAADWLVDSDQPWQQLVGFGPSGLSAYARLRFLPDPGYQGQSENDVSLGAEAPAETEQLRIVLETLACYTSTPDECYFCLWDGWGSDIEGGDGGQIGSRITGTARRETRIAPAFPRSVLDGPKVVVPNRAYYLFRGKLTDFSDWGPAEIWPGQHRLHMPDPAFIWPADRTWCVANDVDPHWAGIGADRSAIDQLVADPRLDVVRANPHENPPHYL
jgi:hypothetical protein